MTRQSSMPGLFDPVPLTASGAAPISQAAMMQQDEEDLMAYLAKRSKGGDDFMSMFDRIGSARANNDRNAERFYGPMHERLYNYMMLRGKAAGERERGGLFEGAPPPTPSLFGR